MYMPALNSLYRDMINKHIDLQQFEIKQGAIIFDCLFSIRDIPFVLSLTTKGANPKFFKFEVLKGFKISSYFKDFYFELAKALNTGEKSGGKLYPKEFLEQINNKIPVTAIEKNIPTSSEVIRLRQDIKEDRERPYFHCWKIWKENSPTKDNLKKTLVLLGKEAYDFSLKMNASSCWVAENKNKNWKDR